MSVEDTHHLLRNINGFVLTSLAIVVSGCHTGSTIWTGRRTNTRVLTPCPRTLGQNFRLSEHNVSSLTLVASASAISINVSVRVEPELVGSAEAGAANLTAHRRPVPLAVTRTCPRHHSSSSLYGGPSGPSQSYSTPASAPFHSSCSTIAPAIFSSDPSTAQVS